MAKQKKVVLVLGLIAFVALVAEIVLDFAIRDAVEDLDN